jgi:hypothetical protein
MYSLVDMDFNLKQCKLVAIFINQEKEFRGFFETKCQ